MLKDQLKKLGFSNNAATIYLKILESGKIKAGEIINQTGLPRSAVYIVLEELLTRNLISAVKVKGVSVFSANSPDHLVEESKNKVQLSQEVAKKIIANQIETPREVVVSEGLEAIMRATDRSLLAAPGETMYVMGASKLNVQPTLDAHWRKYHKKRVRKQIKFKGLYDRTVDQSFIDYRNKMAFSEARHLPSGLEMPVWFNVCADVVSIMVPEDKPPLVFTIRSQATADAIRKYFYYLWELGGK